MVNKNKLHNYFIRLSHSRKGYGGGDGSDGLPGIVFIEVKPK